ncbi:MAG: class I SAM-dependent methyltransferase [Desulfuromonadaceae bacterium]|nr:class I SAM-dependent methyltransferase [Desulfuromonadaceae bacterium]MDD2854105.1 class I SAM-dependent methyltransferase [Desulfuromonadaceae bacterium]
MLSRFFSRLRQSRCEATNLPFLAANVLKVRNLDCLKKAMKWTESPNIEYEYLKEFEFLTDLNDRRIRDAEVLGAVCCNGNPKTLLEIGTSYGRATALMAQNASQGIVYTVNIPPEDISEGGKYVTFAPRIEEIGKYYRERKCTNVKQIFVNTKNWIPDLGLIDVAFIDGCHDADYVYNDTIKILANTRPGSVIMWHDFSPELVNVYDWISSVCEGVERLYADGFIKGKILHLVDSWIGLYIVPKDLIK